MRLGARAWRTHTHPEAARTGAAVTTRAAAAGHWGVDWTGHCGAGGGGVAARAFWRTFLHERVSLWPGLTSSVSEVIFFFSWLNLSLPLGAWRVPRGKEKTESRERARRRSSVPESSFAKTHSLRAPRSAEKLGVGAL